MCYLLMPREMRVKNQKKFYKLRIFLKKGIEIYRICGIMYTAKIGHFLKMPLLWQFTAFYDHILIHEIIFNY